MKIALKVLGVILVLAIISVAFASMGLSHIKTMSINDVDLSKVPDGVYTGGFQKARWNHEVEVTVKDHKITEVKNTNKPADALITEAIDSIIAKQSVLIDVVSGATVNTRAFQKAVENALLTGISK